MVPLLCNSVEVTVVTNTSVSGKVVTNSYVAYNREWIVALSLQRICERIIRQSLQRPDKLVIRWPPRREDIKSSKLASKVNRRTKCYTSHREVKTSRGSSETRYQGVCTQCNERL
jgi:hypothetical protein